MSELQMYASHPGSVDGGVPSIDSVIGFVIYVRFQVSSCFLDATFRLPAIS